MEKEAPSLKKKKILQSLNPTALNQPQTKFLVSALHNCLEASLTTFWIYSTTISM